MGKSKKKDDDTDSSSDESSDDSSSDDSSSDDSSDDSSSDDSSSSSSSDDDSSNSSDSTESTTDSESIFCVHLDKDWCPGTCKLRTICREVAEENECSEFSEEIRDDIIQKLKGMEFYRAVPKTKKKKGDKNNGDDDASTDSTANTVSETEKCSEEFDDEVDDEEKGENDDDSKKSSESKEDDDEEDRSVKKPKSGVERDFFDDPDEGAEYGFGCYTMIDDVDIEDEDEVEEIEDEDDLYEAIRPFYEGEIYMIQNAHPRDVYFKLPNHPGTQAFIRASQQLVVKLGVRRDYDEVTHRKMTRLLYDSKFFLGRAPRCFEADEKERDEVFRARYEFDRRTIRKLQREQRIRKPIPGTVWCDCSKKRDYDKDHCCIKILTCLPRVISLPIIGALAFTAFGFLYFGIWYVFKTLLTTLYVVTGTSISFMLGGGNDDEFDGDDDDAFDTTAAATLAATFAPTLLSMNGTETIDGAADTMRHLRAGWTG